MKKKTEKEILGLFEKKGKYKTMTIIFSVVSIMMLLIDIMLCIVNFPFVKFIFNSSILLSLSSITIYVVFDHKLENTEKYLLYLEDKNILSKNNINESLTEREISKINKKMERYSSEKHKLINRISLDTLLKLKDSLEVNNII